MTKQNKCLVAAIPNYNMADSLKELVPQLLALNYDAIYVLDDASTDNSRQVCQSFNGKIQFIAGETNIGAAGNRNRVLAAVDDKTLIHFIDADTKINKPLTPEMANEYVNKPGLGFVGGTIFKLNGAQHEYNYGPRLNLVNDWGALLHFFVILFGNIFPDTEQKLRKANILKSWPNPHAPFKPREVYWSAEANLLIPANVLRQLNGFDSSLRDHDILDLSIRAHKLGLKAYFEPEFSLTHTAIKVRSGNRRISMFKAEFYIARKTGLKDWLLSRST